MAVEFTGSWLATARGGMWSIESPQEDQVHLEDIAAGLSRSCRYAGQIAEDVSFYSVAEHSVIMTSHAVRSGLAQTRSKALCYLLHDGSEAYFGDMPTPLKALVPQFREFEERAQAVIFSAFGLTSDLVAGMKPELKRIDTRVRIDEREVMIREPALSIGREALWHQDPTLERLGVRPLLMDPTEARYAYLEAFAWIMEMLPDDVGSSRGIRDAAAYLAHRGVSPRLPDFTSYTMTGISCDIEHTPC